MIMVLKKMQSDLKICNCLNVYRSPITIVTRFFTALHKDMMPHCVIFWVNRYGDLRATIMYYD